jgi:hypothetical protein
MAPDSALLRASSRAQMQYSGVARSCARPKVQLLGRLSVDVDFLVLSGPVAADLHIAFETPATPNL